MSIYEGYGKTPWSRGPLFGDGVVPGQEGYIKRQGKSPFRDL